MDSPRLPEQPLTQRQLRAALGPQTVGNSPVSSGQQRQADAQLS